MSAQGDDDLDLVLAAREGDQAAFGALFDRWFDRVFDVSYRVLRDRDLAAETAQDVFLVGWQQLGDLRQPGSFGGWLLRMSRNRSLNRLERERRSVALGDEATSAVIDRRSPTDDVTDEVDDAEQADLIWAAAAALGARDASVLDLHLRHGFGAPEIAETLDITTNNAHQLLFRLRDRLGSAIRGWVLWRNGSPACPVLGSVLAAGGVEAFDADAVTAITRHASNCDECTERQASRLSPQAMFAAVPIAVVAPFLKTRSAAALAEHGVPMQGSTAIAGMGGSGPPPGGPDTGAPVAPRRGARTVRVLMAAVAVVLVLGAVTVLAESLGDGTREAATPFASEETSTTRAPSTTTSTDEDDVASATTTPADVADPLPPPEPSPETTTTSQAPPQILSFVATVVTGSSGTCGPDDTVALSWRTAGGDAIEVTWTAGGTEDGFSSLPASGTASDCVPVGVAPPSYTLAVSGPGGAVTETRTP